MTRLSDRIKSRNVAASDLPAAKLPTVGPWQLVQRIGEGNFTQVYRARPGREGCVGPPQYAIKLLRQGREADHLAIASLRNEAAIGQHLSHPHLVPILAAQTTRPPYYVVMPWLAGATLRERLDRGQCFRLAAALWIARQVADGLSALHQRRLCHADLKAANIMLSPGQHITLLDYGFARRSGELDGTVPGTLEYLAPETVTMGGRPDIRSDIYGLGVTLFELLAGHVPFASEDRRELVRMHREQPAPDLRNFAPHVPREVARLVAEMLAKEPLRRPQTPAQLIERLVRLEIAALAL